MSFRVSKVRSPQSFRAAVFPETYDRTRRRLHLVLQIEDVASLQHEDRVLADRVSPLPRSADLARVIGGPRRELRHELLTVLAGVLNIITTDWAT
ncbi:hypothetical protein [Conexibacter woesei]|uniref:hypothetical protein n=1 Tax=Conexibacter woesei TaxID=191495 RepID=UPI0012DEE1A1|nr:hypothetical protein [Conexibacter woesei]